MEWYQLQVILDSYIFQYRSLRSISTLTKRIIIYFSKNKFLFFNFEITYFFHDLLWYCHMSSEIIQKCSLLWYLWWFSTRQCHILHKISFHYFKGLLNNETKLRVRCSYSCNYHISMLQLVTWHWIETNVGWMNEWMWVINMCNGWIFTNACLNFAIFHFLC
jgi:hypothetical protein